MTSPEHVGYFEALVRARGGTGVPVPPLAEVSSLFDAQAF